MAFGWYRSLGRVDMTYDTECGMYYFLCVIELSEVFLVTKLISKYNLS